MKIKLCEVRGFTLLELLTVVVLLSVIAVFAVPMSTSMIQGHSLAISSGSLTAVLVNASQQAQRENRIITVNINEDGINEKDVRYWTPQGGVVVNDGETSSLYFGAEGYAQEALNNTNALEPLTLDLCMTFRDGKETSKSIIVNHNLIYAQPDVKQSC